MDVSEQPIGQHGPARVEQLRYFAFSVVVGPSGRAQSPIELVCPPRCLGPVAALTHGVPSYDQLTQ